MEIKVSELPQGFEDRLALRGYVPPEAHHEAIKALVQAGGWEWKKKKEGGGEGGTYQVSTLPLAFDIETTSITSGGEKKAWMYVWQLGVGGAVLIGRTWDQALQAFEWLCEEAGAGEGKRLIVFVHNLSYEFQFIRKYFTWIKVFALKRRTPLYCVTDTGLEFRCSYQLSGASLGYVGEHLAHDITKAVGDLDYSLPRHSGTPLTDEELGYCIDDVRVVMAYVSEKCKEVGGIDKLPLTATGFCRSYCRTQCLSPGVRWDYRSLLSPLTLDASIYKELQEAFAGGFTHASSFAFGKLYERVTSIDFTSSYPAVMVAERYPMGPPERIPGRFASWEELMEKVGKGKALAFRVRFKGLIATEWMDHPMPRSKVRECQTVVVDSGRVVSAEYLTITCTDQDFLVWRKFYSWDKCIIYDVISWKKDYLPTPFVNAILQLYKDKTELKGVAGKEQEYQLKKSLLNACFGMCVTNILRPIYGYEGDEWQDPEMPDTEEEISKYNDSKNRFLYWPWGVWITAYARRNLFAAIYDFKGDYLYSDTDSIKCLNFANHQEYIDTYNSKIQAAIKQALCYHGLPSSMAAPLTKTGIPKPLGVWDYEGEYRYFKTLGPKRYLYKEGKHWHMTVAGVNPKTGGKWMEEQWGDLCEIFFDTDLVLPPEAAGILEHCYLDSESAGECVDYLGQKGFWHEKSSVHMAPGGYSFQLSDEYAKYLAGYVDIDVS